MGVHGQSPEHEPGFELIRAEGPRAATLRYTTLRTRLDLRRRVNVRPRDPPEAARGLDLDGGSYRDSNIAETIDTLERDLVGLVPVKTRIREIAALLLVESARRGIGLQAEPPSLHMCFTGNPGTGKTTVAQRMADILHRLSYIRRNHVVTVTRDDLVGQYIGHTAPKTKEILKKAMGGVLFIDEAYYLYRPENERDYGQEAIEILLQVMEKKRDDLVVVLAGYKDRMDTFFRSNPGMASRIAHHIDFPDYSEAELMRIAALMVEKMHYRLSSGGESAMREYIGRRMTQPRFSNARSIRNALDRARLRQANRIFAARSRARHPPDAANHRSGGHPRQPGVLTIGPMTCRIAARRSASSSSKACDGPSGTRSSPRC